jgi:hypothetical protein
MKVRIRFIAIITAILLSYSCKKSTPSSVNQTPAPPETPPFLYIGGASDFKGIYWKFSLADTAASVIADTVENATNVSAIVISDSMRYMVGGVAGYWKNKNFITLPGAYQLNLLAVSGTTVYTAGSDISLNQALWTNSTESENLTNAMSSIFVEAEQNYSLTGIALSGSNVLVSGTWVVEGVPGGPDSAINSGFGVLFTNGVGQLLPYNNQSYFGGILFHWTNGVTVSGSDIYVAGILPDAIADPKGGFWKNGVWTSINNGQFRPNAIASSGSNVVITGYTYPLLWNPSAIQAAYWQNGNLTMLNGSQGNMVAVYGNDVYVLGSDNNGNIVVWKNGSLFKTLNGIISGSVSCIAVGI